MPGDPLFINQSGGAPSYDANELRQGLALALMYGGRNVGARQGVRPGGTQLQVSLSGSTITVAAGIACVDPALTTTQGPYWVGLGSAETHTLAAAHATNPRKDIVILRVYDHDMDSSGLRTGRTEYLQGTAAPSPVEPAVPAGAFLLYSIDVPQSGGGSAVVTDRRPWTVASGGILPVRDQAERDALSSVAYNGQSVWRQDRRSLDVSLGDGSTWVELRPMKIAEAVLASAQASISFPSIPNTFRNLRLVMLGRSDAAGQWISCRLRFNNDSTGIYDHVQIYGSAAGAGAGEVQNETSLFIGDVPGAATIAGSAATMVVEIPWYANTTFWKYPTTDQTLSGQTAAGQAGALWSKQFAGRWRSTTAINRVDVILGVAGNFVAGSSFALYGLP